MVNIGMRMGRRELDAAEKSFSNSTWNVPVNHGAATKAAHDTCDGALHLDVVGASARSGVAACWISGQQSATDHTGLQYNFCTTSSYGIDVSAFVVNNRNKVMSGRHT